MLYLTINDDYEENHGFRTSVSSEKTPDAFPIDLTDWGEGSTDLAQAIYSNPGSADGIIAIVAAVAQTAFDAGILHQQSESGVDSVGTS